MAYLLNDRLYIHLWVVWKIELLDNWYCVCDDNWFHWKVWRLINRNYCRLLPKIKIQRWEYSKWFEFWWLIWNFSITLYKKNAKQSKKTKINNF